MVSTTYKLLKCFGFNYSESEYGNVSVGEVINKTFLTIRNAILINWLMNSAFLSPILPRFLRPKIWKWIGCKVGKNVFIGADVYFDTGHADLVEIEDYVHVTARCLLLCHQRDLYTYKKGDDATKLKYKLGRIHLKKGCMIGMNSMIMPGVTIGEGAIIGAFSLVTKNIPAWTIATGRPAKVIKLVPKRED